MPHSCQCLLGCRSQWWKNRCHQRYHTNSVTSLITAHLRTGIVAICSTRTSSTSSSSPSWLRRPDANIEMPMLEMISHSADQMTRYDDQDEEDIQVFRKVVLRHIMGDVWSPIIAQVAPNRQDDGHSTSTSAASATTNRWLEMVQGIKPSNAIMLTRNQLQDLLAHFDPLCPPPATASSFIKQLWLECESQLECTHNYQSFLQMAISRNQYSQLSSIQRYIRNWYTPLQEAIVKHQLQEHQQLLLHPHSRKYYAYISAVPSEKLAILTAYEILTNTLQRGGTVPFAALSIKLGEAVEAEFHMQKLLLPKRASNDHATDDTSMDTIQATTATDRNDSYYKQSSLEQFIQDTLRLDPTPSTNNPAATSRKHLSTIQKRIKRLLQSDQNWSTIAKARVGAFLVDCFLQTATFSNSTIGLSSTSKEERAFTHEKKWTNKRHLVGHVTINPKLLKQIVNASQGGNIYLSSPSSELKYQPMVYPPRPWKCSNTNDNYNTATEANSNSKNYNHHRNKHKFQGEGSYYIMPTNLMRTKGCAPQNRALKAANLDVVLEGLNALGRVPWKIHSDVLQVAQRCWRDGIALGDIPSRQDFDVPQLPERPNVNDPTVYADKVSSEYKSLIEEWKVFRTQIFRYRRMKQKNMVCGAKPA